MFSSRSKSFKTSNVILIRPISNATLEHPNLGLIVCLRLLLRLTVFTSILVPFKSVTYTIYYFLKRNDATTISIISSKKDYTLV